MLPNKNMLLLPTKNFNYSINLNDIDYIDDNFVIHLKYKSINSITDLIYLSKMYIDGFEYNINLKKVHKIKDLLEQLNLTIGLDSIKKELVKQICFYLQDFHNHNDDMLHIVIQGPPGTGKSLVAEIIGKIYFNLGIFKSSLKKDYKFIKAKRSDLIGQYLGTTAKKTQDIINKAEGGVLFIDEVYSLGNKEGRDSYAKECIDTINQNLTEKKANLLMIIAGYETDIQECFFNYNAGLKRRFPFVYTLNNYTFIELSQIFERMLSKSNWKTNMNTTEIQSIFEDNTTLFTHQAGDIETLTFKCKLEHSKRVFGIGALNKFIITKEDLLEGIESFKKNREKIDKHDDKSIMNSLYI